MTRRDNHRLHFFSFFLFRVQVRSLDNQLHPERLKVITQQVEEEQAILQSQTLLRLQQIHAADRQTHSPQVRVRHTHTHTHARPQQSVFFF